MKISKTFGVYTNVPIIFLLPYRLGTHGLNRIHMCYSFLQRVSSLLCFCRGVFIYTLELKLKIKYSEIVGNQQIV